MKMSAFLISLFFAHQVWAIDYVYLVAPKTVTISNEAGTSCLAAQNGQKGDINGPHIRMPATIANPQSRTFFATSFRIVIFLKGEVHTCDFKGEDLKALGLPSFGVPSGYQATTACELACGDLKIPAGKKAFATLEVNGYLKLPLDENKTVFQETSFEIVNPATTNP